MSNVNERIVSAAILVIGDEILSGRTKDKNIGYIAEYLTAIGVDIREVRVVPDVEAEIVRSLVAQVTGTVRWRESVGFMAEAGVRTFYEVGAGKVLTGLAKRLAEGATASAIGTPEDVAAFKAART